MRPLQFIGVKIVDATPMTREAFEAQEGRNVGGDKHGDGYMVTYEGGYRAWSPKDLFDAAYRPIDGMTFGLAIEALKMGKRFRHDGPDTSLLRWSSAATRNFPRRPIRNRTRQLTSHLGV